ncbi:MAG TPA: LL-diaminopimelate aminotransferase [Firmicutes bacterium]|jgi:LL-diaminopimelate aminotransferase|nr:LL-diaminopimelate aminotransferase [Bacillota bacterium]HHT41894.1 LL-diaminopimelate aminotransferase [Bacillota bacterium]
MRINRGFLNLQDSYLFSRIAEKVTEYQKQNPEKEIIRLGIGDVTLPLAPAVIEAMQQAVSEMGSAHTFRGYGEEQGYAFLRRAVCGYYASKGVELEADEVFISDGAKSDLGNIPDVFAVENTVLVPDPVYPVYLDTNVMAGRSIIFSKGSIENGFLPLPEPGLHADLVYLCSPNNPTGAVYTKEQLKAWVDWALDHDAVIIFDSAYEAFVQDQELPTSIYQIEGAKSCAIEFCSLSKTAGFTGIRCGYTVVPQELVRDHVSVNRLWLRRQTTKFNGVSYIVQRGAEAVFTEDGLRQTQESINYYRENARLIADTLAELGLWFTGGTNAPYIWLQCPNHMSSWEFFDLLLERYGIVGTPGSGFGENGEGFFRLTAFGRREEILKAMDRLRKMPL